LAFQKVASKDQVPPGSFLSVEVGGEPVAIYNVDGAFYATRDECTHDGGTLSGGTLEGDQVVCPRHGAKFDVTTGEVKALPAFEPVETFELKLEGDDIYVDVE